MLSVAWLSDANVIVPSMQQQLLTVAYLPLGHAPPFELRKNLAYGKKMQP